MNFALDHENARSPPAPGRSGSSRRPGLEAVDRARRCCAILSTNRRMRRRNWCRRRRARRPTSVLAQAARCGVSARTIAGACSARRRLERLRADQHADVEQDRRDRDHRDDGEHQRDDAEPRQHDHHHAGRRRVADAAAHRLPAGMADIDRVDERVAHQAADQADDAVGGQHARGRIGDRRRLPRFPRCPSPRPGRRCRTGWR